MAFDDAPIEGKAGLDIGPAAKDEIADSGAPEARYGEPEGDTGAPEGDTGAPEGDTGAPEGDTGAPEGDTGAPAGTTDDVDWFGGVRAP
jgi:hypothetical protein